MEPSAFAVGVRIKLELSTSVLIPVIVQEITPVATVAAFIFDKLASDTPKLVWMFVLLLAEGKSSVSW